MDGSAVIGLVFAIVFTGIITSGSLVAEACSGCILSPSGTRGIAFADWPAGDIVVDAANNKIILIAIAQRLDKLNLTFRYTELRKIQYYI
jgi:hypothetical protein